MIVQFFDDPTTPYTSIPPVDAVAARVDYQEVVEEVVVHLH